MYSVSLRTVRNGARCPTTKVARTKTRPARHIGKSADAPPRMLNQAMTVMLSGLGDSAPAMGDRKAAFVDGVLNWMSHQMAIANGIPNATAIDRRTMSSVPADVPGGMGTARIARRLKTKIAARKPAKIRIDVRAHERRRKSPTEVQMPMPASATNIAAVVITKGAPGGGWDCGVSMNSDATTSTAMSSANNTSENCHYRTRGDADRSAHAIIYFFIDYSVCMIAWRLLVA